MEKEIQLYKDAFMESSAASGKKTETKKLVQYYNLDYKHFEMSKNTVKKEKIYMRHFLPEQNA